MHNIYKGWVTVLKNKKFYNLFKFILAYSLSKIEFSEYIILKLTEA